MSFCKKLGAESLVLSAFLFLGVSTPACGPAREQGSQQTPDNSKTNQRDRDKTTPAADDQKMTPADRDLVRKIRSAIHEDKSLSTYAHNIKVISRDGKVTLKGPVRSEEEKSSIVAKATAVAGERNVDDQLQVGPPKS
jgi:hyperosmotically inducible protein